jgi:hypothetical protein
MVCEAIKPDLGILQSDGDVLPAEAFMWRGIIIQCKPFGKNILLIFGQEGARFGVVGNEEVSSEADKNGCDSLENEDPLPAIKPSNPFHVSNGPREYTAERASEGSSGKEERDSELSFNSQVEESEIEDDAWEQASFCDAEEEADDEEAGKIRDDALEGCDDAPDNGDGW